MSVDFIKRFQMVFDAAKRPLSVPRLLLPFRLIQWRSDLSNVHAQVKYESFHNEPDAHLFPTFQDHERCRLLMNAIASNPNFIPQATWLIAEIMPQTDQTMLLRYIAGIQGMRLSEDCGAIQNVAVLPEFRRRGIGTQLLTASLNGFKSVGISRVSLEVTAENNAAVRLYEKIGFDIAGTNYREVFRKR